MSATQANTAEFQDAGKPVAPPVYIVDQFGNPISSFGGGTQYTDGASAPAHPVGTEIVFNNAGTMTAVSNSNGLPINGSITATNPSVGTDGSAIPTSSTLIGVSDGTNLQQLLAEVAANPNLRVVLYSAGTKLIGQKVSAGSLPVVLASDQSAVPVSGTVTANAGSGNYNNASVGTDGSAIPAFSTLLGASDGTNLQQLLVESAANRNLRTAIYNAANELGIDANGVIKVLLEAVSGTALLADQGNTELRVSTYIKTTTAGDTALTAGQATMANSVPVAIASNQSNVPENLAQVGGSAIALGQTTMASSLPVALASNQSNVPSNIAQVGGSSLALGQATMANSLPVAIASNQGAVPVGPSAGTAFDTNEGTTGANTLRVVNAGAATGTKSNVAGSASSVTVLASNTSRKGAIIYNDSTAILYLDLSGGTASTSSYSVQIASNGFFELPGPIIYNGLITGIWSSATGNARVTEFS